MTADDALTPGRTIGPYVLHDVIATGGMAEVRLGRMVAPGGFAKIVAVKQLRREHARDPELAAMLVDEARLASRIRHANVVSVLDVVEAEGDLFIVMEYVDGESLGRLLWSPAPGAPRPPIAVAAAIVRDVLRGLEAAHEATDERGRSLALIHRDVSPENVLVGRDGMARIADFGIAKAAGRVQRTREGSVKGKVAYMAPEHARGADVTLRSDLYACGIVLWEALVGERLFTGLSEAKLFLRVLNDSVPAPSLRSPHVPEALDRVVLDAVARDPDDRYESARDFADALAEAIDVASPSQVAAWVESAAGPALAARDATLAAIERLPLPPAPPTAVAALPGAWSTGRSALVAAALCAVVAGGLLVARLTRGDPAALGAGEPAANIPAPPGTSAGGESMPIVDELEDLTEAASPAEAGPRPRRRPRSESRACDPPYDVDSAGRKHYRVECVRGR